MSKKHVDSNGFTVNEGHQEIDWSFLGGKLDNTHEDNAFGVSSELDSFLRGREREQRDEFEQLCDGVN